MLGYIEYGDGPKRPELSQRQLAGGTFAVLALGQSAHSASPLARGRAVKGARQMREAGVRTAVFPVDFPYTALFIRQGILPVDTLPLRRALAAPLVRRRLEDAGLDPAQAVQAVQQSEKASVGWELPILSGLEKQEAIRLCRALRRGGVPCRTMPLYTGETPEERGGGKLTI